MNLSQSIIPHWRRWRDFNRRAKLADDYRKTSRGVPRLGTMPAICLPLAEEDFDPPLFMPTHRNVSGNHLDQLTIQLVHLTLYRTLRQIGVAVNQCGSSQADLVVTWAEKRALRGVAPENKLFLELGWLPRTTYQLSPLGVNTRSHVARDFTAAPLDAHARVRLRACLARQRRIFAGSVNPERVDRVRRMAPGPFVLFAFQLANDFNLKHSESPFAALYSREPDGTARFAQACVDWMNTQPCPLPVCFKQHPADASLLGETLKLTRPDHHFWSNADGFSTHEIFASGLCRLVVCVNSNTLHEAACWGVPGIALGNLLWTPQVPRRPYPRTLENVETVINTPVEEDEVLMSYLYHLLKNQWTLNDFANPQMVSRLLETRGLCVPHDLREELGLCL